MNNFELLSLKNLMQNFQSPTIEIIKEEFKRKNSAKEFIIPGLTFMILISLLLKSKNTLIYDASNQIKDVINDKKFFFTIIRNSFFFKILKHLFFRHTYLCVCIGICLFIISIYIKKILSNYSKSSVIKIIIKEDDVKNSILYFMENDKEFPKLELKYNSKTSRDERISIIKSLHKTNKLNGIVFDGMTIGIIKEVISVPKELKDSNETEMQNEEYIWLEINRKKYNSEKLKKFIHECMELYEKDVKKNTTTVNQVQFFRWKFSNNRKDWTWVEENPIQKRSLDTLIGKQHDNVIKDVDQFEKDSQFYIDYGIPYKRSYILHGPPGTGKSTLIRVVATKFGKTIFNLDINLPGLTDEALVSAVSKLPLNAMIILEDIGPDIGKKFQNSTLLNVLDGVCASYGNLIFLTTNNLKTFQKNVNPAFFRPGRIDQIFSIDYSTTEEIEEYFIRFYTKASLPRELTVRLSELARQFSNNIGKNNNITVAELQRVCVEYRVNPEKAAEKVGLMLKNSKRLLNTKIENITVLKN